VCYLAGWYSCVAVRFIRVRYLVLISAGTSAIMCEDFVLLLSSCVQILG
jgi:hypothetical protein